MGNNNTRHIRIVGKEATISLDGALSPATEITEKSDEILVQLHGMVASNVEVEWLEVRYYSTTQGQWVRVGSTYGDVDDAILHLGELRKSNPDRDYRLFRVAEEELRTERTSE